MRKPDDYFANNWRTAHGSPVMINLIHDIDLIRFVLGEIAEVAALVGTPRRDSMRVESGAIAMLMESGLSATISFADTAPSPWGFEATTNENPHIAETFQDMWWIAGTGGGTSVTHAMGRGGALGRGGAAWPTRSALRRLRPSSTISSRLSGRRGPPDHR